MEKALALSVSPLEDNIVLYASVKYFDTELTSLGTYFVALLLVVHFTLNCISDLDVDASSINCLSLPTVLGACSNPSDLTRWSHLAANTLLASLANSSFI